MVVKSVRYGLPACILIAGLVLILVGGDAPTGAGIVLIGVAFLVVIFNLFARLSVSSQTDREREEAARRYFGRHGRWPRRSA